MRFRTDRLMVEIHNNRVALGTAAAQDMAARMRELLSTQATVRVVFASAPSQNEFLGELAATADIDWSRVEAFHMDEYAGLGREHPQSFSKNSVDCLFSRRVPRVFHALNGLATDPEEESRRHRATQEWADRHRLCRHRRERALGVQRSAGRILKTRGW